MNPKRIIVGVAGGIAAYKACSVVRQLSEAGHDVRVIPTGSALRFVGAGRALREQALRILRTRLLDVRRQEQDAQASAARRSQVRTVDRSERIRTYNFPENRIADHRVGYKAYNLDQVMDGALAPIIDSAIQADEEARLAALADG